MSFPNSVMLLDGPNTKQWDDGFRSPWCWYLEAKLIYLICNSVVEGVSESFKCEIVNMHISIHANTCIPLRIAYVRQTWSSYYSNFGQYLLTSENEIVKVLIFHFGTA